MVPQLLHLVVSFISRGYERRRHPTCRFAPTASADHSLRTHLSLDRMSHHPEKVHDHDYSPV